MEISLTEINLISREKMIEASLIEVRLIEKSLTQTDLMKIKLIRLMEITFVRGQCDGVKIDTHIYIYIIYTDIYICVSKLIR